jgi:hypothetical protein
MIDASWLVFVAASQGWRLSGADVGQPSLHADVPDARIRPAASPGPACFVRPLPVIGKVLALLSLIVCAVSAAADATSGLQMFYCIHAEHNCVNPSAPIPSNRAMALAVAERAFSSKNGFVGFVDADEITLQFYVDGTDSVWVDMPVAEQKGSYGIHTNRAGALQIIGRLSPPLSGYRSELNLVFAKWD